MEESKNILAINRKKEELLRDKIAAMKGMIKKDQAVSDGTTMESFVEITCRSFTMDFINSLSLEQLYGFIKDRFIFVEESRKERLYIAVSKLELGDEQKNRSTYVLDLMIKDHPFIIDSMTEFMHEKRYNLSLMYYNVLELDFSDAKKITSIQRGIDDEPTSYTNACCILKNFDGQEQEKLKEEVKALMRMIDCVTDDFSVMSESMEAYTVKPEKQTSESLIESERRNLFAWFNDGNVILLGAGEIKKEDVSRHLTWDQIRNPLGYVRRKKELGDESLPREIGRFGGFFMDSGLKINLMETSEVSEVHKKERIQLLFGRKKDESGETKVNFYHVLFTNKSLKEDALSIPLARLKVNSILDSHFDQDTPGGQSGHHTKMANDFFSIIPKPELFRLDRHELEAIFLQFLYFGDYQQTKISTYTQPSRRYARITFCLPHNRFSPSIFEQVDKILSNRLKVSSEIKYWFSLGQNSYSHHIFWFPREHPQLSEINIDDLESEVAALTVGWEDGLKTLLKTLESEKAARYEARYENAFGAFYQAIFSPRDAVVDIEFLEALLETGREQVDLRSSQDGTESTIYVFSHKRYHLTEIMPHMQNLALTVIDEHTYRLNVDDQVVYIYTYYVKKLARQKEAFKNFKEDFCDLLLAVLEDRTEDTILNGLLLTAGLNRQEINLFVLYRNYYWQIGAPYLPINKAFLENEVVIGALKEYFYTKFEPREGNLALSEEDLAAIKEEVFKAIHGVETVAEDIIFKTIFNLMEATVRTNYFNIDDLSTMAIKVKSANVDQMPVPRPLYEIYVHGTHVEGIHLRGAMIARGGLRHSDRHDDFRTEILGLMNTQMLKNVVIVPEGSKGGFITKKQFDNPQERKEDAVRQYKIYINSLLSLTDNIVEGEVIPAQGLVRYDGDDPYFVVAADKGTATYSDTANEISDERNFWLGDAFASGGKHGYDHKGMGITAKGGWESVKFHFLEEGFDIQTTDFTVVGIGDMSGDVFGNGMLLSKHIRLVGAFNHIHIFVDPDPDAATSWKERERLFNNPSLTWKDYDSSLISEGGGIFERSAKTIRLTPQIQSLLGTTLDAVSGEELIRLLLQAKVDLLWNGGIGTYVKASSETAHEVGDAANDSVRINADQLRVKAIGEGGNLGLTQRARLEAAARGVKINTDAIDNSGGVDTSDHEVNLKILMRSLIEQEQISSMEERNQLLEDLTDDIADLVLADNRGQVQIMSMDNIRSRKDVKPFVDLIRILSEKGVMDPRNERLSTVKQWEEYVASGLGLPRPDLAILLSYTKMYFYKEIVQADVLDDPYLDDLYYNYFPESFRNQYDITGIQHPLKKEIIGTMLVNRTINQTGVTILPDLFSIAETDATGIITAYTVIDQAFQLGSIRKQVMEELKTSDLGLAYTLKIKLERFVADVLFWMLYTYSPSELKFSLALDFISAVNQYKEALDSSLDPDEQQQLNNTCENLMTQGISEDLAKEIALLDFMSNSFEVIVQAKNADIALEDAVILSRGIDSMFHFQILYNRIMAMELDSTWVKKHRGLLMRQLQTLKQGVSDVIMEKYPSIPDFEEKIDQFLKDNQQVFKQYQVEYSQIVNGETVELSGVAILLHRISHFIS